MNENGETGEEELREQNISGRMKLLIGAIALGVCGVLYEVKKREDIMCSDPTIPEYNEKGLHKCPRELHGCMLGESKFDKNGLQQCRKPVGAVQIF